MIYLFAVFQDLDLVLTASGLVVKVRCPFAFGAHVLVVVQFAQLLTRFFLDRSWLPWAHDVEVENSSEKLGGKKYLESVFEK